MGIVQAILKSNKSVTDRLLDVVSDFDIYCELIGEDIEVGQSILSPLRADDNNPSFNIFVPTEVQDVRPDEIWWKDLARGWFGDVFKFTKMWAQNHYDVDLQNRKEIVMFLDDHMSLGIFGGEKQEYTRRTIDMEVARERSVINFLPRAFTKLDKYWWAKRGVCVDLLKKHRVDSMQALLDDTLSPYKKFGQYELGFAYNVQDKCKIYRPEADRVSKWRSCIPAGNDFMFGVEQSDRSDYLIITKSLKDIMCFKSFIDCDAIAPQSETTTFSQALADTLNNRYNCVYIVMDYDDAGIKAAESIQKLCSDFKVKWVSKEMGEDEEGEMKVLDKDISDLIVNKGLKAGLQRMREMFPEITRNYFKPDRVEYFEDVIEDIENN